MAVSTTDFAMSQKDCEFIAKIQGVIPIDMDDNSRIGDRIAFFDELLNVLESGTDEATVNYCYSCC